MSRVFVALCFLLVASPTFADPKADEADVQLMIGGHFAVDHIGPTAHAAILSRAKARPKPYLAVIERVALASSTAWLSSSYIPYAIELLKPDAKLEATALAKKLLPIYKRAALAPSPASDPSRGYRFNQRIADLERLAK
jgi:hypothetical protein